MTSGKFKVKISCDNECHYLSTTRNGYQWTDMPIDTPKQMRQIASALIAKADEVEAGKQPVCYCPDCGTELEPDEEYMQKNCGEVNINMLPLKSWVLWCDECDEVYNGNEATYNE